MAKGGKENTTETSFFNRLERSIEEDKAERRRLGPDYQEPEEIKPWDIVFEHKAKVVEEVQEFSPNAFMQILGGHEKDFRAAKREYNILRGKHERLVERINKKLDKLQEAIDFTWDDESRDEIKRLKSIEALESQKHNWLVKEEASKNALMEVKEKIEKLGNAIAGMDLKLFVELDKDGNG